MRTRRDESGAIAIVVAASAIILFLIAALVVDLGLARDTRRHVQATADAAALAAGNALYSPNGETGGGATMSAADTDSIADVAPTTAAAQAAVRYVTINLDLGDIDWDDAWQQCRDPRHLPVISSVSQCISFDDATHPESVRVRVPTQTVTMGFGRLAGVDEAQVSAIAEVMVNTSRMAECGLCVIGDGTHDVQNGDIVVHGTSVHFNGSTETKNNGSVTAEGGGSITVENSATGNFIPDVDTGSPAIADPLAGMPMPDVSGLAVYGNADPCEKGPGIYGSPKNAKECTLPPGLYVITGVWKLSGKESITAPESTLYFTCDSAGAPTECASGDSGGSLQVTGNGGISVIAPTSGPTKGIAILYDRNNTADFSFRGNGATTTSGTIYAKSAALDFRGNGAGTMDSLVVVRTLAFKGNPSSMELTYTKAANYELPPTGLHLTR